MQPVVLCSLGRTLGRLPGNHSRSLGLSGTVGLGVSGAISIRPVGPRACKDAGSGWRVGVRVRVGTWTRDLGVRLLGKCRTRKDRRGDRLGAQVFPHPVPPVGLNMQALPDLGEVLMTRGQDGACVPAASLPTCRVFSATASGYTAGLGPRLTGTSNSGPEGSGQSETAPQAGQGAGWRPPLTRTACPGPRAWRTPPVQATRRGRSVQACALWAGL